MHAAPIDVAIVNDYALIVEGLAAVLRPHQDRVRVRDTFVIGEDIEIPPLHLALFDTYGRVGIAEPALRTLTEHPGIGHVAIFSLDFAPPLLDAAHTLGIRAFISKTLDAASIVEAAVRAAAGDAVNAAPRRPTDTGDPAREWPGRDDGLSERESQVLVLCAEGLTNAQIAEALFINIQTVKTHLKHVYRRLGIRNRAKATAYVLSEGAFRHYQPTANVLETDDDDVITDAPAQGV